MRSVIRRGTGAGQDAIRVFNLDVLQRDFRFFDPCCDERGHELIHLFGFFKRG